MGAAQVLLPCANGICLIFVSTGYVCPECRKDSSHKDAPSVISGVTRQTLCYY